MLQRWWSFAVWALVALCAFFWGLHWVVGTARAPAGTRPVALDAAPRGDLTRLFGAAVVAQAAAPAPDAARFKLLGVVAPRPGAAQREGLALIAVDGKLPRSYRPGAQVDGDWVLQSVQMRGASIGPAGGATRVALEIPPPAPAAVGTPGALPQPVMAQPVMPPAAAPPGVRLAPSVVPGPMTPARQQMLVPGVIPPVDNGTPPGIPGEPDNQ